MVNGTNQTILHCPKCFAMADPAFVTDEGEVLWWYCRGCNFQGVSDDFMPLTTQTGQRAIID